MPLVGYLTSLYFSVYISRTAVIVIFQFFQGLRLKEIYVEMHSAHDLKYDKLNVDFVKMLKQFFC